MGTGTLGGIYLFVIIVGVIIAILWILLPFAVFGLKDLMRKVLSEQRRTNELLERIAGHPRQDATRQDPTF